MSRIEVTLTSAMSTSAMYRVEPTPAVICCLLLLAGAIERYGSDAEIRVDEDSGLGIEISAALFVKMLASDNDLIEQKIQAGVYPAWETL